MKLDDDSSNRWPWLVALLLTACGAALGQDLPRGGEPLTAAEARRRASEFLLRGPRPLEARSASAIATFPLAQERWKRDFELCVRGAFVASVDSTTGQVWFYSRMQPLLWIEDQDRAGNVRSEADRAAELARRARYSLTEDEEQARTFLAAHHPAFRERFFACVRKERSKGTLVQDEYTFVERPRAGIAACWPNRIEVTVNPEDGEVTTYSGRDHRIEATTPPRLGSAAALRLVREKHGSELDPETWRWIEKDVPVELVALEGPDGARAKWIVGHLFCVDGATGSVDQLVEGH